MHGPGMFKGCRLARMSDGHYCLLRGLGLVKGGKGMKHHEVVIDFSRRGMVQLFRRLISRSERSVPMETDGPSAAVRYQGTGQD